ncbi:hypothetical protein EV182_008472 [Spiromyces aspiralis]|uniref:Uncharacterized protein n=1 Tax=Spiromyces aspiralis TaxID=68401 RepID=A0ACC1H6J4_9FUNG|nr:hypothetical protein EV182_008472 [Spiromyces aspiralis]
MQRYYGATAMLRQRGVPMAKAQWNDIVNDISRRLHGLAAALAPPADLDGEGHGSKGARPGHLLSVACVEDKPLWEVGWVIDQVSVEQFDKELALILALALCVATVLQVTAP